MRVAREHIRRLHDSGFGRLRKDVAPLITRRRAGLRIVAAVDASGSAGAALPPDVSSPLRASVIAGRGRASIEKAIERALAELPDRVAVERTVRAGDPTRTLLDLSSEVDLLVCGSRGYGPLRGVVLGSVSRRLLDAARCPVLVVPRGVERPLSALVE